ncbi:unnamed protein product, partial [Symbiodinium microadriaticum]
HGGRALKAGLCKENEEKGKDEKKKQQALKQLKEQVAQLTQEKNTLSDEVKSNARDASAKARQIAELTAQVSQQQSTIASLRAEVAKKPGSPGEARKKPGATLGPRQPSAAAGNAEMEAKRLEKLTAEASRQQQEIASLTSQLSAARQKNALKIKHETLQQASPHLQLLSGPSKPNDRSKPMQEYGDPSIRYFLASKARIKVRCPNDYLCPVRFRCPGTYWKATKVYGDPGIQGAANKTFKYVLPHIAEALKTSTEALGTYPVLRSFFSVALLPFLCCTMLLVQHGSALAPNQVYAALNESLLALRPDFAPSAGSGASSVIVPLVLLWTALNSIREPEDSMHSILGSETSFEPMLLALLLPTMSAFLVYGLMLSYALEWVCKLRELLLLAGFCISALAAGFVAVTQRDPLKELYEHVFVLQQSGFFVILVVQLLLIAPLGCQTIALCGAASADDVPVQAVLGMWKITIHLRRHDIYDDDDDDDDDDDGDYGGDDDDDDDDDDDAGMTTG